MYVIWEKEIFPGRPSASGPFTNGFNALSFGCTSWLTTCPHLKTCQPIFTRGSFESVRTELREIIHQFKLEGSLFGRGVDPI